MTVTTESKRIEMKVPARVKAKLVKDSKACGLTCTDYLTQLIMGYSPGIFNPDICRLMEAIDSLHFLCPDPGTSRKIDSVLNDIRTHLMLPQKGGD